MTLPLGPGEILQRHLMAARKSLQEHAPARARESLETAAAIAPKFAETHFLMAVAFHQLGQPDAAERAARLAAELDPNHGAACHFLGALLMERGMVAQAEPWLREGARLKRDDAAFQRDLGAAELFLGRTDEGRKSLMRAAELDPLADNALYNLTRITRITPHSADARRVLDLLRVAETRADTLEPRLRVQLLFALAKAHEDLGEHDRAFAYLMRGSELRRPLSIQCIETLEALAERVIEVFDASFLRRLSGDGAPSPRPVFILGMPRSGTTLIEQILAAHPRVHGAGEVPILLNLVNNTRGNDGALFPDWGLAFNGVDCRTVANAYLAAMPTGSGAQVRTTDKRLDNVFLVGLIAAILPEASLIHCQRDPRDVAYSCLSLLFADGNDWSYSMEEVARYWRLHERLMAHWRATLPNDRLIDVSYEGVVGDLETWSRRIVSHVGLDWNVACLEFHRTERAVTTASMAQVREPIYDRSIGRWRPYAGRLAPMFEAMGLAPEA